MKVADKKVSSLNRTVSLISALILIVSSLNIAGAQETQETPPFTLASALSAANSRTDVINAQLSLNDANLALARTQADPLALRLEQVQANQRARLSAAELTQAQYQAIADISSSYTQVLEAQAQRDLAAMASSLSAQSLEIAKIRQTKGSATTLDVQEAANSLEDSNKNLASADQGVALAKTDLTSLVSMNVDSIQPIDDALLTASPAIETVLSSVNNTPTLIQVANGAELAQVAVDLLDPSYASQSQIDDAQLQASQAAQSLKEARRGLEIQAQSLYNQTLTAQQNYNIQLSALNNALERENLEKQRLDAGLIADIQFRQTQLSTMQARIAAMQAKHSYLNSLLNLQAGTMTQIEGLNGY